MNILPLTTDPKNYEKIERIATEMVQNGLPPKFVKRVQTIAMEFEGAFDLMVLWQEESDVTEKGKIIAALKEHVLALKELENSKPNCD